jgi:hypothetical protein
MIAYDPGVQEQARGFRQWRGAGSTPGPPVAFVSAYV